MIFSKTKVRQTLRFIVILQVVIAFFASTGWSISDSLTNNFEHRWERILYPAVQFPNRPFEIAYVIHSVNRHVGLQVQMIVTFSSIHPYTKPRTFNDSIETPNEKATMRLIKESGAVVPYKELFHDRGSVGRPGAYSRSTFAYFPWSGDCLDSVWIEVSFGQLRHYLELPYGFACHPQGKHHSDTTMTGPPKFPTGEHPLKRSDHIIAWNGIQYESGAMINGQRFSLIQTNPGDGISEVILYREDSAIGKSMYLWKLDSPKTSLKIKDMLGNDIISKSKKMGIRLHEDGMRRSDTFKLPRKGDSKRIWAKMVINVDQDSYSLAIPSSMFQFVHGQSRNHITQIGNE